MADATPAPAKSPKKAKGTKKQAKPTHPPYKNMILAAIKSLKERSGSSRQAILKYITSHYKVGDEKKAGNRLRLALKKGVDSGDLKQVKGSGASGSFRIAKDEVAGAAKKKPAAKKAPKAKKPAAAKKAPKPKKAPAPKKAAKPKAPKKPKTPKKPKAAKKPAAKKAKRPLAKKAAKK